MKHLSKNYSRCVTHQRGNHNDFVLVAGYTYYRPLALTSMNYVIRVGHLGGQPIATRVGVAVNMVKLWAIVSCGSRSNRDKGVLFFFSAACSHTQSGRKNL